MSLLSSAPGGLGMVGWRLLLGVTLAFCLMPALLGGVGLAVVSHLGPQSLGSGFLHWSAISTLVLLSPMLTWAVWAVIGGGAALLLRRGAYGAVPALVLGGLAGGTAGLLIDQSLGAPLGAVLATFHRFTLALLRPMAF